MNASELTPLHPLARHCPEAATDPIDGSVATHHSSFATGEIVYFNFLGRAKQWDRWVYSTSCR
jgi:hypothetical protein